MVYVAFARVRDVRAVRPARAATLDPLASAHAFGPNPLTDGKWMRQRPQRLMFSGVGGHRCGGGPAPTLTPRSPLSPDAPAMHCIAAEGAR